MMIRVVYHNGRYDMVNQQALDRMIDTGTVSHFRRSSGWVTIGRDQVRMTVPDARQPEIERRSTH
ncbi:MAG: hypothetical protein C0616_10830 [Desulfuromonas sp.]|nr:MAG: hypothetical protein C0616_10830 [Desulfuromonas sp.]